MPSLGSPWDLSTERTLGRTYTASGVVVRNLNTLWLLLSLKTYL